jgi:hypothetical protein
MEPGSVGNASYAASPFPALWAGRLVRILDECGLDRIIDIGSGSSGPMELVLREMAKLGRKPSVTHTDLYPVRTPSSIDYWPASVCATCVPAEQLEAGGTRNFRLFTH